MTERDEALEERNKLLTDALLKIAEKAGENAEACQGTQAAQWREIAGDAERGIRG